MGVEVPPMSDPLLTARDVADRLNVSPATVLRWTARGDLPGFRMPSGALRYREDALAAWLDGRATPQQEGVGSHLEAAPPVR